MTFLKSMGRMIVFAIGTELFFQFMQLTKWKFRTIFTAEDRQTKSELLEVVFFPDSEIACKQYFCEPLGCVNPKCKYTHKENSLAKLFKHLSSARNSIDVCVYTITCLPIVDILITATQDGVTVRIITDIDQTEATGSHLWKLRSKGICVRTNKSKFYMHHKFTVIDDQVLLNGSFNWTRNAVSGNQENLLITNHPVVVQSYISEFNKLWTMYDENIKSVPM